MPLAAGAACFLAWACVYCINMRDTFQLMRSHTLAAFSFFLRSFTSRSAASRAALFSCGFCARTFLIYWGGEVRADVAAERNRAYLVHGEPDDSTGHLCGLSCAEEGLESRQQIHKIGQTYRRLVVASERPFLLSRRHPLWNHVVMGPP